MNPSGISGLRAIYYLSAAGLFAAMFFSNAGDYFHGGTPLQLIGLQVASVIVILLAIKLFRQVGFIEKLVVTLCAAIPALFIGSSLVGLI